MIDRAMIKRLLAQIGTPDAAVNGLFAVTNTEE